MCTLCDELACALQRVPKASLLAVSKAAGERLPGGQQHVLMDTSKEAWKALLGGPVRDHVEAANMTPCLSRALFPPEEPEDLLGLLFPRHEFGGR